MTFRRFFAISLLTTCIGSATILGLFFYRLDIDLYRPEIEKELVNRTHLPLTLGKVGVSFKHGPAIAFDNLEVEGGSDSPLQVSAKSVYLRLRLLPMIYGQLAFSEILLEEPDIRFTLREPIEPEGSAPESASTFQKTGEIFRSIRIHKGNFRFEDRRNSAKPFTFALEQLELSIDDLSFSATNRIAASGELLCNNIRSPLQIRGRVRPDEEVAGWRHADYDVDVTIRDLASDIISSYLRRSAGVPFIRGRANFNLHFSGAPAEGVQFETRAIGRDLGLHLPGTGQLVLPIGSISLVGNWRTEKETHAIEGLQLHVGPLQLSGRLGLDLGGSLPQITASLTSPPIPLTDLEQMLPFVPGAPLQPPRIDGGRLTLKALEVSGTADQITGDDFPAGIRHLALQVDQADIHFGSLSLAKGDLALSWKNHQLVLERVGAQLGKTRIDMTGHFAQTGSAGKGLGLNGEGKLTLKTKADGGVAPLLPERLDAPFQAQWQQLPGTESVQLRLHPAGSPLQITALWRHADGKEPRLAVDIESLRIAELTGLSPLLRRHHLGGELSAHLDLRPEAGSWQHSVTLELLRGSTPIPGPLAALHDINGSATIVGTTLRGKKLAATLGDSPIEVDVDIPDLAHPVTTLHVISPEIHARDLVFSSPTMTVDNVDGYVRISPGRVDLGPIDVMLPAGTEATVFGSVDTRSRDVDLAITSPYGDIDEVISLWNSPTPAPEDEEAAPRTAPPQPPGPHGRLDIAISTDRGEIAGMPFTDATAHVTRRGDDLVIYPIRFHSGPGVGLGQVVIGNRPEGPPKLKISGNLVRFDAPVVHQQLLKRTSVISGTLSADFYLEGIAGSDFLPTSVGGASFELRDGNLHKISWLSKTLTILNIYPLLTKGDSDLGLPYNKVNADLTLRHGVISTENLLLKGDVMNLSMVGSQNLLTDRLDATLEAMPLRSVDRILTRVPIAGWVLTGENKALLVAHFRVSGPSGDPDVDAIPLESVSAPVIGIFKRLIGLPVKLITDPKTVLQNR